MTCLARGSHRQPPRGVAWIREDRDHGLGAYEQAAGEWDAVVDVSWRPHQVRDALEVLSSRAAHWTYVSSTSVYADHSQPGQDESAKVLAPLNSSAAASLETYGEAKVACERSCTAFAGDRLHLCRPGLIAGAGDTSDRFGYWPARFARDQHDSVLVPDALSEQTQVIWVVDLAGWILDAAESHITGPLNAVGDVVPLGVVLERAQSVAKHEGDMVPVTHDWLVDMNVSYWAGPDSLPLWLPPDYHGFASRSNAKALAAGLRLSSLTDLMNDSLEYEGDRGLKRHRSAGLSPDRERALLQLWGTRDG